MKQCLKRSKRVFLFSFLAIPATLVGMAIEPLESQAQPWTVDMLPSKTQTTEVNGSPGMGVESFDPDWSPTIGDKRVKILNYSMSGPTVAGDKNVFEFGFDGTLTHPWYVDLAMAGSGSTAAGNIEYLIEIDSSKVVNSPDGICGPTYPPCHPYFDSVSFDAVLLGDATATKTIMNSVTGSVLAVLSPGSVYSLPHPLGFQALKIQMNWNPGATGTIVSLNDKYRQSPGPLPVLGAGAAFGFSRKLRGRIKASRIS